MTPHSSGFEFQSSALAGQYPAKVACPAQLIRGREHVLLNVALPAVESAPLMLDMSAVEAIDAAGLGALMMLRHCAEQSGYSFQIVSPSTRVLEMLRMTQLDSVLLASS